MTDIALRQSMLDMAPNAQSPFFNEFAQQEEKFIILIYQMDYPGPAHISPINRKPKLNQMLSKVVVFHKNTIVQNVSSVLLRDHFQVKKAWIFLTDIQQILKSFALVLNNAHMVGTQTFRVVLIWIITLKKKTINLGGDFLT